MHQSKDTKDSEKVLRAYYSQAQSTEQLSQADRCVKSSEMLEAAYRGDKEKVKGLIREGAHVSTRDIEGRTAGNFAIENGDTSLLKTVLEARIDPRHGSGFSAPALLQDAAQRGSVEMVKMILDTGFDIEEETKYYDRGKSQIFSESALMIAAKTGQVATAQMLLDHGAKTDTASQVSSLFVYGHVDVVRILVAHEHDIDHRYGEYGATLLHLVAVNHTQLVPELIERGFELNAKDLEKRTPLSYGCSRNAWYCRPVNAAAAILLLSAGAEISILDWHEMPSDLCNKYAGQRLGNNTSQGQ